MKQLIAQQADVARQVMEQPADYGLYREMRGRWLGLGDALNAIKEAQDAADK